MATGEFLTLLGPSGCAETTLRMIGDLRQLMPGSLYSGGCFRAPAGTQYQYGFPGLCTFSPHDCRRKHCVRVADEKMPKPKIKTRIEEALHL